MNEVKLTVPTDMANGAITIGAQNVDTNIVCNGFKMKDVILDVLKRFQNERLLENHCDIEGLAIEIQDAFAVKMGIKQG